MIPGLLPVGHLFSRHRSKIQVPNHHEWCQDTSVTPECRAASDRLRQVSPEAYSRVAHFQGSGDMFKAAVIEVIYNARGKWSADLRRTVAVFLRDCRKTTAKKNVHSLSLPECHIHPVANGKRLKGLQRDSSLIV